MKNKSNIAIHPDDIKGTKVFQGLSKIQQKINMNRNSRIAIQNSVNICLNIGVEKWLEQTNGNWYHQEVVKELVELKSKKLC